MYISEKSYVFVLRHSELIHFIQLALTEACSLWKCEGFYGPWKDSEDGIWFSVSGLESSPSLSFDNVPVTTAA